MSILFLRTPTQSISQQNFKADEIKTPKIPRKHRTPKASNGEKFIIKILNELKLEYQREYSLSTLPKLRYDFCLKDHKILIEYDSNLHMEFCKYIHKTMNKFIKSQQRDILKTKEAIENNYLIIRIDYTFLDKDIEISNLIKYQIERWDGKGKCVTLSSNLYKYLENEINPKIISKYKKKCIL